MFPLILLTAGSPGNLVSASLQRYDASGFGPADSSAESALMYVPWDPSALTALCADSEAPATSPVSACARASSISVPTSPGSWSRIFLQVEITETLSPFLAWISIIM